MNDLINHAKLPVGAFAEEETTGVGRTGDVSACKLEGTCVEVRIEEDTLVGVIAMKTVFFAISVYHLDNSTIQIFSFPFKFLAML